LKNVLSRQVGSIHGQGPSIPGVVKRNRGRYLLQHCPMPLGLKVQKTFSFCLGHNPSFFVGSIFQDAL
jgi:hypothetical protein